MRHSTEFRLNGLPPVNLLFYSEMYLVEVGVLLVAIKVLVKRILCLPFGCQLIRNGPAERFL